MRTASAVSPNEYQNFQTSTLNSPQIDDKHASQNQDNTNQNIQINDQFKQINSEFSQNKYVDYDPNNYS